MAYITWEYYSSLFTQITDEQEFNRLVRLAQAKLDALTHARTAVFVAEYPENEATPFQQTVYEQIRTTLCDVVNAMAVQEKTGMGSGVTSVSNAGYAETYKITTAAEKEQQIWQIVRSGLIGTGLAGAL